MITEYAALIRPAIDRLYTGVQYANRERMLASMAEFGVSPGAQNGFYFGLLARPMSAAGYAAALTYAPDPSLDGEIADGILTLGADGELVLTEFGRTVALAHHARLAETAEELWTTTPRKPLPGLASLPRLAELLDRVLAAGAASGGPAFATLSPPYAPAGGSVAGRFLGQLGALRHHRGDAHRAAWAAAGLTVAEIGTLTGGPVWEAIEADTNRRDAPAYAALSEAERWELLAGLAALPG